MLLTQASAHDHYSAGFQDANANNLPDAGEALRLFSPASESFKDANGSTPPASAGPLRLYNAAGEEKLFHLLARPVGFRPVQRCGGYYMLDDRPRTLFPLDAFSLIAQSDGQYASAGAQHAHTGAYIWMEIVSVSGPPGASFGLWEENHSFSNDTPTISFAANQPTGNYQFPLSEGFDDAGEDPLGHIHGRSWTADKPGDYLVSFRLVDRSTSGPNGGPWHAPSPVHVFRFRAGPSFQPTGTLISGTGYVLTWPSQLGIWTQDSPPQTGIVFSIERSTALAPTSWQNIGNVTGTTSDTATFTDTAPPAGKAFYRLKYSWSAK